MKTPHSEFGEEVPDHPSLQDSASLESISQIVPTVNLTSRVRKISPDWSSPFAHDPVYDAFFDRFRRSLHRSDPRHILLIRERGVGEQAVLIDFAQQCLQSDIQSLKEKTIVTIDCRHLVPEMKRSLIDAIFTSAANRANLVLCLDGFINLLRGSAGHWPAILAGLTRVHCRIIGILSPQEYDEQLASDADCHDQFTVIHLHEPAGPVAVRLVGHFAENLEYSYKVKIASGAINRAVVLSNIYILHERLPQKAVRILRSICDDIDYDRSSLTINQSTIDEQMVISKIGELSGIPVQTLFGVGEKVDYNLSLKDEIVGQDHAVKDVATELGLIKAGFVDSGKPASVMLFIGQTGTGKTEMAKALARLYSSSKRLKTFTLGNFSEPHSVSGIIGVPAGYVGHDQGGRLVNELNADPYGVFLLDEADKAHPDVLQPFLNLFDEGWLYDQRGIKAFADRAIFILTTNVGQRQIADMFKAGKSVEEITHTVKETLARTKHTKSNRPVFTPEFLARIKRIIVFKSLDASAMHGIAQKLVGQMIREWAFKRQKVLSISFTVIEKIAEKAYAVNEKTQGKEGGRIVRKYLAECVEANIQRVINEHPEKYRECLQVSVTAVSPSTGENAEEIPLSVAVELIGNSSST